MTPYRFLTTFAIAAPQRDVFHALAHLERWASEWSEIRTVAVLDGGQASGRDRSVALILRAPTGYVMAVHLTTARIESPTRIDVVADGDVVGRGSWQLREESGVTTGTYLWEVATTKRWMNWLAPVARRFFEWNHDRAMHHGMQALARHLRSELLAVTTTTTRRKQDRVEVA